MLLSVLLVVALTVYALLDVWGTPEAEVQHLPPPTWVIIVVALPVLGPIAWLVAGKPLRPDHERQAGPQDASDAGTSTTPEPRLKVPDTLPDVGLDPDDPEDRWLIEQRDRQRAQRTQQHPDAADRADVAEPPRTPDRYQVPRQRGDGGTTARPVFPPRPPRQRRPESPRAEPRAEPRPEPRAEPGHSPRDGDPPPSSASA